MKAPNFKARFFVAFYVKMRHLFSFSRPFILLSRFPVINSRHLVAFMPKRRHRISVRRRGGKLLTGIILPGQSNLKVRDLKTYRNQAVVDVIGKGRSSGASPSTPGPSSPTGTTSMPPGTGRSPATPLPDIGEAWALPGKGAHQKSC